MSRPLPSKGRAPPDGSDPPPNKRIRQPEQGGSGDRLRYDRIPLKLEPRDPHFLFNPPSRALFGLRCPACSSVTNLDSSNLDDMIYISGRARSHLVSCKNVSENNDIQDLHKKFSKGEVHYSNLPRSADRCQHVSCLGAQKVRKDLKRHYRRSHGNQTLPIYRDKHKLCDDIWSKQLELWLIACECKKVFADDIQWAEHAYLDEKAKRTLLIESQITSLAKAEKERLLLPKNDEEELSGRHPGRQYFGRPRTLLSGHTLLGRVLQCPLKSTIPLVLKWVCECGGRFDIEEIEKHLQEYSAGDSDPNRGQSYYEDEIHGQVDLRLDQPRSRRPFLQDRRFLWPCVDLLDSTQHSEVTRQTRPRRDTYSKGYRPGDRLQGVCLKEDPMVSLIMDFLAQTHPTAHVVTLDDASLPLDDKHHNNYMENTDLWMETQSGLNTAVTTNDL